MVAKGEEAAQEEEGAELEELSEDEAKRLAQSAQHGIAIQGIDNIMVHLGKCCTPVPGDDVIGYITRGRGVTVHRSDCTNIKNLDPDRKVEVSWHREPGETYPVRLQVMTSDKKGMLAAVSNAISNGDGNIKEAKVVTTPDQNAMFHFVVEVQDSSHLKKIINGIRRVQGVNWVGRASYA